MRRSHARPGTPGASRKERIEQSLRARATSDTVRTAFPAVEHIRLTLTFIETTEPAPAPQTLVLHPPAQAYFAFPCPWSDCDGQFDLGTMARDAIERRKTTLDGSLVCDGQRARNRSARLPCGLRVNYSLGVQYLK